LKTLVSAAD